MGGHMMYVTSSGLQTTDQLIYSRECLLYAVTIVPAAAASSVVVYDNNAAAAAGTVLMKISSDGSVNSMSNTVVFNEPVHADNGLYADVTGASAGYILHYCPL